MIEIIIRSVPPKDTTAEPLAVFNIGEPGEVVTQNQLWRVRMSEAAERAKVKDEHGKACYAEGSRMLLRIVYRIIGHALEQAEQKPVAPPTKRPTRAKAAKPKKRAG